MVVAEVASFVGNPVQVINLLFDQIQWISLLKNVKFYEKAEWCYCIRRVPENIRHSNFFFLYAAMRRVNKQGLV